MMRVRSASLWAGIISGGISQFQDTKAFRSGQLNTRQYATHTTKNITGAVGIVAGLEYGALLGTSIMPGIGTIAGTVIGGFLGDRLGTTIGLQAGNLLFDSKPKESNLIGDSTHMLAQAMDAMSPAEQHEQMIQ
jgi:outer membrane lipoprotein SlyB